MLQAAQTRPTSKHSLSQVGLRRLTLLHDVSCERGLKTIGYRGLCEPSDVFTLQPHHELIQLHLKPS